MNPAYLFLVFMAVLWNGCSQKGEEKSASSEKPADSRVKHDAVGRIVITLAPESQKALGLEVKALAQAQLPQSIKSYGRVLEGSQLAAQLAELTAASAGSEVSQKELQRLKTLVTQNNASERAVQTAEGTAAKDQAQVQALRLRLVNTWGKTLMDRSDLPMLAQSLASFSNTLVQLTLSPGETLASTPLGARILPALSTNSAFAEAQFAGSLPTIDPQLQGQALLFIVSSNFAGLIPGAAVTGYVIFSGEPQQGVLLPSGALVRFNGTTWIYLQMSDNTFSRVQIHLEQPLPDGWFVREPLKPGDKVVIVGAQMLLSEELKEQTGE